MLILSGNSFENNHANHEGGAIKWKEIEPTINNDNIFKNNSAFYGDIDAAFPFRIEMEFSKENEILCIEPNKSCYVSFRNIVSGSQLNFSTVFSIKDIYNQTISSLNDEFIYKILVFILDFVLI